MRTGNTPIAEATMQSSYMPSSEIIYEEVIRGNDSRWSNNKIEISIPNQIVRPLHNEFLLEVKFISSLSNSLVLMPFNIEKNYLDSNITEPFKFPIHDPEGQNPILSITIDAPYYSIAYPIRNWLISELGGSLLIEYVGTKNNNDIIIVMIRRP